MSFLTEPKPQPLQPFELAPDIVRITADNPSKMTYHGTNTYLIEHEAKVYVLDPGPSNDQAHLAWLAAYAKGRAAGIILSHHHSDHFGLAPQLRELLGVPVYAYGNFADDTFKPDIALWDGDKVAGLDVLHTPGHASDHLCFAAQNGVLFSGDHVMSWNSSMVGPPDGDMSAYVAQLKRLLARDDNLYLPGHGPPLPDPRPYTQHLLDHRMRRENAILEALKIAPATVDELADSLYNKKDPHLVWAAKRNVEAHLQKLMNEGQALPKSGGVWALT